MTRFTTYTLAGMWIYRISHAADRARVGELWARHHFLFLSNEGELRTCLREQRFRRRNAATSQCTHSLISELSCVRSERPNPALVSVIWLCDEAKHFRGMELALNGVNCRANNCFDINGVPHLGKQMNAGQHRPWAETGWSASFRARRNPDATWAATIEHQAPT